ncbi:efflux RND transporter permease subunit, partial [Salmonella enterica]|uniref:efflux RND transporter permease subunit n=1 Tax=Salmonella enterica TaxID=28901 RepID=UPI00398C5FA4
GGGGDGYNLTHVRDIPGSVPGVKVASAVNEIAAGKVVLDRLNELAPYFPHGMEYKIAYETTSFVKASIIDVVKTLLEAIALAFTVRYMFQQNYRAPPIPKIPVAVALLATVPVLYAFAHRIATLSTSSAGRDERPQ